MKSIQTLNIDTGANLKHFCDPMFPKRKEEY